MHLVYTIRLPSPPGPTAAMAYLNRPKGLAEIGTKLCKGYHLVIDHRWNHNKVLRTFENDYLVKMP